MQGFMNNVPALVITKAQLKLEPTSGLLQWALSSCTPQPMAGPGALAHSRLKGGPRQKKESMDQKQRSFAGRGSPGNHVDLRFKENL